MSRQGAIILCGGRSSRLGSDKALLPFGNETMLQRIVGTVASVVEPRSVIVIASPDQQLPPLAVPVARDETPYQGPLHALTRGFTSLPTGVEAVFVTGCDAPLLQPAVMEWLFNELGDFDAAIPFDGERFHPLCAIYRRSIVETINRLLAEGQGALQQLAKHVRTKRLSMESLRAIDPDWLSFQNVNTQQDYSRALAAAGFSTP